MQDRKKCDQNLGGGVEMQFWKMKDDVRVGGLLGMHH